MLLPGEFRIPVETEISVFSLDLLAVLSIKMVYRYAYKFGNQQNSLEKILRTVLKIASFGSINPISIPGNKQIKVAIIGAGSVIPLFKKQIAVGGPITITDKRIIRYFMTIPEASQLVLTSGAMAKNGELFVLDMGSPVKILDLAINMIRLSGMVPYKDIEIVETGLRPGEKLYEELLVKSENLDKTDNELIFVERDAPYSIEEIEEKLNILRAACETRSDEEARLALMSVVPTFRKPEEVNAEAEKQREMQMSNT